MARIFVSYSRSDRPKVKKLIPLLREVYGMENVWWDENFYGGQLWWDEIKRQISASDVFIYLMSSRSLGSPYCTAELEEARRLHKQILYVKLRRETFVPEIIARTHYVHLTGSVNRKTITPLIRSINEYASRPQSNLPPISNKSIDLPYVPPKEPSNRLEDYAQQIIIGIIVTVIGGIAVAWFTQADRFSPPMIVSQNAPQTLSPTNTPVPPTITETPTSTSSPTSTVTPIQEFHILPLEDGELWGPEGNLGLIVADGGVETKEFAGVPFEIRRGVTTFGCSDGISDEIELTTNVPNPIRAYFLIQAGNAYSSYAGLKLGSIQIIFSNGVKLYEDLILGMNIRDWSRNNSLAVIDISSPRISEVWTGTDNGREGGIDMLVVPIPNGHGVTSLQGIEIVDTSDQLDVSNSLCIHITAITIESNS